ncbi:HSP20-like chaperone [Xylariales sp. PMI_506]|nr:HSP20-like chaperone [Xylariales sp. PMI_506]
MEFLPHSITSNSSFHPLFRFLEDFDRYRKQNSSSRQDGSQGSALRPVFDICEFPDSYELFGELPGVEKKDLTVELSNSDILLVQGLVNKPYARKVNSTSHEVNASSNVQVHSLEKISPRTQNKSKNDAEVDIITSAFDDGGMSLLVHERRFGKFMRSFSFPEQVRAEGIGARLENGILHVHVPKATKDKTRIHRVDVS